MLKPGRDRTDDVFRSMEVRVLSPKLRVGKTQRSGAPPDNRNVIAARVVGQFEPVKLTYYRRSESVSSAARRRFRSSSLGMKAHRRAGANSGNMRSLQSSYPCRRRAASPLSEWLTSTASTAANLRLKLAGICDSTLGLHDRADGHGPEATRPTDRGKWSRAVECKNTRIESPPAMDCSA